MVRAKLLLIGTSLIIGGFFIAALPVLSAMNMPTGQSGISQMAMYSFFTFGGICSIVGLLYLVRGVVRGK